MENLQHEVVLVVDFGAQYSQLIARRVRECGVYCEIIPYNYTLDQIKAKNPKAIILSGGPNSVYAENTPSVDEGVFEMGIPVLGICYGDQFMTKALGGVVAHAGSGEYGKTAVVLDNETRLFSGLEKNNVCWMSHQDYAEKAPEGFTVIAHTEECPIAAMQNEDKKLYGVQFIRKSCTLLLASRCSPTSCSISAICPGIGPCLPLPRTRSGKSGKK